MFLTLKSKVRKSWVTLPLVSTPAVDGVMGLDGEETKVAAGVDDLIKKI